MSTFQKLKKLKTATSLQTCCTFDDASEKEIKVQVLSPKNTKKVSTLTNSSIQLVFQEDSQHQTAQTGKSLLNIPMLSKRNGEMGTLGGSGSSDPITSQRLQKSNRYIEGSGDFLTESLNFRTMNITHQQRELASSRKLHFDYNNNVISQQHPQKFLESQKLKKIEPQKKLQTNQWEKDSKKDTKQSLKICQQQVQEQSQIKAFPQGKKQYLDFKPIAHQLKLSSKYDDIPYLQFQKGDEEKNKSQSKIKLKDYLYRMETSSKRSRRQAASPIYGKEGPSKQLNKVRSEKIINHREIQIASSKHISTKVNHQSQKRQKYGLSNKQMLQILKEEIYTQISKANSYLKVMYNAVLNNEREQDPSDDNLLVFYNIRRRMREDVNKKLADILNQ